MAKNKYTVINKLLEESKKETDEDEKEVYENKDYEVTDKLFSKKKKKTKNALRDIAKVE